VKGQLRYVLLAGIYCLPMAARAQHVGSSASPDDRAAAIEQQMTDDERFAMVLGIMPLRTIAQGSSLPEDAIPAAGYVPGVPRLGVPSLRETDASLGVANPQNARRGDTATALPAGIMLGATFDPDLARQGGAMVAREARSKGFNVLLGGGMNLMRDPRNGRNFEYISEDPLVSGLLAGAAIAGTQSEGVISTVKHYALNAQESQRHTLDAVIDPDAFRESDLLAFHLAIEQGHPGSVMCAYNKVNGAYACGNDPLLNGVLKRDWGYSGWVMSDWGAVHAVDYAVKGLDQESGSQVDTEQFFGKPLRDAVASGAVPKARLSDMVRRILRSIYAVGVDKEGAAPKADLVADRQVALDVARAGIVMLKNDGALPLAAGAKSVAVIGGHANIGVISGGGSSQVIPVGGYAARIPLGGDGSGAQWRGENYAPSAPLDELRKRLSASKVDFDPGTYPAAAAALARRSDVAIVFVTKHESEGIDSPDLSLPGGQDAVIEAVAAANPNTIVVLETGNPVLMPWADKVKAVLAAWFPGQAGGQALAEVLTGAVNPSGRLPVSFPASINDLPRPHLDGFDMPEKSSVTVRYPEGADVGYRWYAKADRTPLYPFGYGLSYTHFSYSGLQLSGGDTLTARFTVRNDGDRPGADVPQLYLTGIDGKGVLRLIGFQRLELAPGQSRTVTLTADPRLLSSFDGKAGRWRLAGGNYKVNLAHSATALDAGASAHLAARTFGR
jgi:beta-glucosidase